ncbi:PREDICTED: small integral membrane protein 15-like [Branchiostoma belcheri]|uniref:Small integral membrane protein 15 n=1 Tax=Branchiostoma belcheri TaxID=7741 RepID=A0A6P4ZP66_BRABE|nr:PREDICTED: small integral membrane protein 15-like [Branchiostoma belcheri]
MADIPPWLEDILKWAATNPWEFIYYVLLCLSPFFFISALLSWKLAQQIDARDKEKKRKAKREANIAKARGRAKQD